MATVVRAFLTILALGAGLAALLAAWVGFVADDDPDIALSVAPSARALQASLEAQRRSPHPPWRAGIPERARELHRRAPLRDAPFALIGLEAAEAGNADLADRSFSTALARNPRNAAARIWLAQRAIDAGRFSEAVALLDRLIEVDSDRAPEYLEALVQVGSLQGGVEAIADYFGAAGTAPRWGGQVTARLNRNHPDLEALARLNQMTPGAQAAFIERVRAERGPEPAFTAWLSLLPPADVEAFSWPYDPTFLHRPAPPPFNWAPRTDQVEFQRGGGLAVTYMGRGRVRLIDQHMLLRPGTYRLTSVLSGEARDSGGRLGWSIACVESNQELALLMVKDLFGKSVTDTATFVVPEAGCGSQRLSLDGVPGEFPTRARAEVQSIAIDRLEPGAP